MIPSVPRSYVPYRTLPARRNNSTITVPQAVKRAQKTYCYRAAALAVVALSSEIAPLIPYHPIVPIAIAASSFALNRVIPPKHTILRHKTWLIFNAAVGATLAPLDVSVAALLAANVNLGLSYSLFKTKTCEQLASRYAAFAVISMGFHAALQSHMGSVALAGLGMTCITFFESGRLLQKTSEENYDPLNGSLGLKNPS